MLSILLLLGAVALIAVFSVLERRAER